MGTFNAALMVEEGLGCALSIDGLTDKFNELLTFRPFEPHIRAELYFAWKKYRVFSKPAELFLQYCYKNSFAVIVTLRSNRRNYKFQFK